MLRASPARAALAALILCTQAPLPCQGQVEEPPKQQRLLIITDAEAPPPDQELARAFADAAAMHKGLRVIHSVALTQHRDEERRITRVTPPLHVIRGYLQRVDAVVVVGLGGARPFLVGKPIARKVPVYALGLSGAQWLSPTNRAVPNLHRLRGGIATQVTLADLVRATTESFEEIQRIGVILHADTPTTVIEHARKAARAQGATLHLASIQDPTGIRRAGARLVDKNIDALLFPDDPRLMAGRRGRLAVSELRLRFRGQGVAIMGLGESDPHSHYRLPMDPVAGAAALIEAIVADRDSRGTALGIRPAPRALRVIHKPICERDGIKLRI